MKRIGFAFFISFISAVSAIAIFKIFDSPKENTVYIEGQSQPFQLANYNPPAPAIRPPVGAVDFTFAAQLSTPTVVHVKTSYESRSSRNSNYNFFKDFFGDDSYDNWWDGGSGFQRQASGSGVIISSDGYIVTNFHVVKDAATIQVVTSDRKKIEAELIGTDPSTDLALLKMIDIDGDVPHIRFADSDSVKVGEWVLAVGNPFDLASTVTAGIVSAKGRKIDILGQNAATPVESFIQTDAAVNPGNSGGALVNTHGRLIGINTAIATPTGTFAGYSFAVPVNIVKKVVNDLMNYGVVQRGYLGVQIDINRENLQGVFVSEVLEGTGSEEAGIEPGDIITRINGNAVETFPELQERLSQYGPGDRVKVDFIRDGANRTAYVQLRNKNKNTEIIKKEEAKMMSLLGADFEDLTLDERRAFDLEGGVKVSSIYRDGKIYEQTSIREGFVITSIDDEAIDSVEELRDALQSKRGGTLVEGFYPQSPYKIYNYYLNIK